VPEDNSELQADPISVDPTLLEDAEGLLGGAVSLRREIHAHPEIGLQLPRTQEVILDALEGLGLEVATGREVSSVVAVLEGGRDGPTTLLRGDMDGLPMPEDTGLEFASRVEGAMHACGHDAHVAMLVGAARLLAGRVGDLAGRVLFMFQPGEEGHGGAKLMLDEGLLSDHGTVDRAFAIHTWPTEPSGVIATRGDALMASADSFQLTINGKGGHASMPDEAVDPIPVACEVVLALQAMVTRRIPAFDPAVVTIAHIAAGTTSNVIPEAAVLEGTVRAVSEDSRALALDGVRRVAEQVAAAHLCTATLVWTDRPYPVTINSGVVADQALALSGQLFGEARTRRMATPIMGAEDWSYVLQRVPGAMAFLGTAPAGVDHPAPNHSNRMLLDEAAMRNGIALHAAMALSPPAAAT
jgi:hippurate hydrolase